MKRVAALLLAGALLRPGLAQAQADPLRAVEDMIAGGRFTQARATLDRWQEQNPAGAAGVSGEQHARAMLLRARLASDAIQAQEAYLSLVLSYPSSTHAPEALLRLGQALLASGETARAAGYLQRVVLEHPTSPQRATAMLWLARARAAAGEWPTACQITREALATPPADQELAGLLRTEEEAACSRPAEQRPPASATGPPRAADRADSRRQASDTAAPPAAPGGAFSVQVAAVRSRDNANGLAGRMRSRGFDARVVVLPANDLLRVRVGRHASAQEAAAAAQRLREAGYEAIVVDDARNERAPPR